MREHLGVDIQVAEADSGYETSLIYHAMEEMGIRLHTPREEAVKRHRETDGSPAHKHILKLRHIWCEGSFAAQKWMHNLTRLFRRGIEAAQDHCLLSATALNLKRMVKCLR